jgi:cysteine-rich repeat protein
LIKYSLPGLLFVSCFSPPPFEGTSTTTESSGDSTASTLASEVTGSSTETGSSSSSEPITSTSGSDDASTSPATGTVEACGDGQVGPDEECDDGATLDGDGCSLLCKIEFRRVFVTSAVFSGEMGGRAGADARCQAAAETATMPGIFRAWLSADQSGPAVDFTKSEVPYVRIDNVQVAADWNDLIDGQLEAPISISELGGPPGKGAHDCLPQDAIIAWTSTSVAGEPLMMGDCNAWSGKVGLGAAGRVGETGFPWSFSCTPTCSSEAALYCVEQ